MIFKSSRASLVVFTLFVLGAVLSFTDTHQLDIRSGRTRWVKAIYGLPMLYYTSDNAFSEKLKQLGIADLEDSIWVNSDQRSPFLPLAPQKTPYYGIVWHCNMACNILDFNCVSEKNQKLFFQYLLQWLSDHQFESGNDFPTRQLIDLSGGPIECQIQYEAAIPVGPEQGNLLELYIETQFGPLLKKDQNYNAPIMQRIYADRL